MTNKLIQTNKLPLCHWWKTYTSSPPFTSMANNQTTWFENSPPNKNTCESCNQSVIKTEPVNRSLSLKICKYDMAVEHHFDNKNVRDYIQQTPNCSLIFSNYCRGKGLVNISAIWQCVLTYSSLIVLFKTCSLRKWNLIGICFVFECRTGFLEMLMALVLWQKIGIGSHKWHVYLLAFVSSIVPVCNNLQQQCILLQK